jgi:hypothetical protein
MLKSTCYLVFTLLLSVVGFMPHYAFMDELESSHTFTPPPSSNYLPNGSLMTMVEKIGQELFPEDADCTDGRANPKYDARISITEKFTHLLLLPYTKSGYDQLLIVIISPDRNPRVHQCEHEDRNYNFGYRIAWLGKKIGSSEWTVLKIQPLAVPLTEITFFRGFYFDQLSGGEWVLMVDGTDARSTSSMFDMPWYLFVLRNDQMGPLCWAPAKGKKLGRRAYYDDEFAHALGCLPVYFTESCQSLLRDRHDRITAIYERECEGQAHPEYNNEDYVPPKRKDYIEYYSQKRKTFVQSSKPMTESMMRRLAMSRSRQIQKRISATGSTPASSANGRTP